MDISDEFGQIENTFFLGNRITEFDVATGSGLVEWKRYARKPRMAFDQVVAPFESSPAWEFPPVYGQDPALPFEVQFVTERTVRLRWRVGNRTPVDADSLMLAGAPGRSRSWAVKEDPGQIVWQGPQGSMVLSRDPWHIEFRDAAGRVLTRTQHLSDSKALLNCEPLPFGFVRGAKDLTRHFAATFSLAPDEQLFGCGESFTRLNKRGQKIVLWTCDAHGVQTGRMYKPVPFFLSNRGYGMFVHSSAPMTFDFGHAYDGATTLYVGDDVLDLFVFLGSPAEILEEYTALTGRSPMPPLWSFGLWMSRITYKSEAETREVAGLLRQHRIPCDVIHLDTSWFETDWLCDYKFAPNRFDDPARMIRDLREQGFRISLWQLPYFSPANPLYREAVEKGYVVRDAAGGPATEDAIIDFSNPDAVRWYQNLLAGLLILGVGAIKADFGEAAPLAGLYASGCTGWREHNLYPLRYNKAVADVSRETTGEAIIWARSAWAGSQRYPLHWGGDAENTDCGMAASLRAGLSLGLCGFSFWSHDIGGFVQKSPEALYRRWMPFGMLTSHSRCHGAPPKEPWHYGEAFTDDFRLAVELKYRLMPYVYAQAKVSSEHGWPLLRPLFFHYPDDPTSWLIEDEYLFGSDLLVAPLMEESIDRRVYLPPGGWIDYQTGRAFAGTQWHTIEVGALPCVILVRDGAVLPRVPVSQHTGGIDWIQLELAVFATQTDVATAQIFLPGDVAVRAVQVRRAGMVWTADSTCGADARQWKVLNTAS
ncbi:MAG: TIM-barrel domain-containing protein [bacterium]